MKFVREVGLPYPQPWEYILSLLGEIKNGVFVDVGAYDGNRVSNSIYFEDVLNWTGICIEPNPNAFNSLRENRNCICINAGISDINSEIEFYKVSGHAEMLSGFLDYISEDHKLRINDEISKHGGQIEVIKVKTIRLDKVFKDNNITKVNYLSIDTEGNELNVIKSIDFNSCQIDFITAENNDRKNDVRDYLEKFGYQYLGNVCGDDIYKFIK